MFSVGWIELAVLMAMGVFWMTVVLVITAVVLRARQKPLIARDLPPPGTSARFTAAAREPVDVGAASATIVARLTQRFCPQCRSPLGADAPEGLCPACLLAGALPSSFRNATEGVPYSADAAYAVTTPPSGSQPPATGEWADLQRHYPDLEILELLGRGGMGAVYKARQKNLDRMVALKVIPPEAAKDPAFTERFNREARAMARLNHPSIVTVYNFGQEGDLCWLLMEYVDGVNLRHTLRAGRLAPREALAIVPQICDALQYAHDAGVVHRDIKPENVLLDRSGRVKIADFGLAKLLGKGPDDFTLTHTQQIMGTPRYMAPEQIDKPSSVDHRADIYSLGVVLYEMLTGELPMGQFALPSEKVQVDVRIDQVVMRALAREPERRYQRASQVKTELISATSWADAAPPAAVVAAETAPTWQTPAPAQKPVSPDESPTGAPLPQVLAVAIGMVLGVLMMAGGLATGTYAMTAGFHGFDGAFWGWMGGAFGCLVGGFGSFVGSYNTYRQLAGAEDLMRSPRVTWFDWVVRSYLVLGILTMLPAIVSVLNNDAGEEHVLPMLLLGGIATSQSVLFLLWRTFVRPVAATGQHLATSAERMLPAEPSYLRGVLGPAAILLGVWLLLFVDVAYSTPLSHYHKLATLQAQFIQDWYQTVIVSGMLIVPLAIGILAAWREWGPRLPATDGAWSVPFPFAGRGWAIAVAVLAAVALITPWFTFSLVPGAMESLSLNDVFSSGSSDSSTAGWSVQVTSEQLQEIAALHAGWRYGHRGIQQFAMAGAVLLLIAGALATLIAQVNGKSTRGLLLLMFGGAALALTMRTVHDAADNRPSLVVDSITEQGLRQFAADHRGSSPATVQLWVPAISDSFYVRPAIGLFLALAASVLAIFLGATELCWGAAPESVAPPAQRRGAKDEPQREAVRQRVAGPAIGLMVAGAIGLLPIAIAMFAVTTVREVRQMPSAFVPRPTLSRAFALAASAAPVALANPTGLPLLLAQAAAPPQPDVMTMPLWASLWIVPALANLLFSGLMIAGGWRMGQLKSYGLAVSAAVVALIPCTLGWLVGLPIGIWALSVLTRPEVRDAFES